eukprot:scaffold66904_cov37-Phaeocystis_antarctica.AAC.4
MSGEGTPESEKAPSRGGALAFQCRPWERPAPLGRPTERERPRLVAERSVLGHRLPNVSRRKSSASRPHKTSQRAGQPMQALDRAERGRMPIAEGLAQSLQRLAAQRFSGGDVALGF